MANLVPKVWNSAFQNLLVNLASRSEMMDLGKPWSLMMWSKNSWAVSGAVAVILVGAKCTIFENVSTNTTMASYPDLVVGSWTMKSINTWSQGYCGIGSGWRSPAGTCWLALIY